MDTCTMKKAWYVFGFLDTNTESHWEDFSESCSKSVSSCQSNLNSEPHDGSEVILDCRNAAPAALSATAAQISQHRELPRGTHSSSTIYLSAKTLSLQRDKQ